MMAILDPRSEFRSAFSTFGMNLSMILTVFDI